MENLIGVPVFIGVLLLAMVLGATASATRFCTMGGVSDWLNIGDTGRLLAWFMAIAVAIGGATLLEASGIVSLDATRPPYRATEFAWPRYLLGGFLFGIGMVLASGCPTRNVLRVGSGSLKGLVVLLLVGISAWLMTRTDLYAIVFHSWLQHLSVNPGPPQDLGALLAAATGMDRAAARMWLGGLLALALLIPVLRSADFRSRRGNVIGGVVVGLCVTGAWYLTGGPWGRAWQDDALWLDQPPIGVGVQSYTFVNPLGETLTFIGNGGSLQLLTVGMVAVLGVLLGALAWNVLTGRFRWEWFTTLEDFLRHAAGAVLMGVGGVLALGCSVGQGITGVSTLALGSWLALAAMIIGAATALRVQYYRLLHEDASLLDALISAWVDLHLLPRRWRRLDAL